MPGSVWFTYESDPVWVITSDQNGSLELRDPTSLEPGVYRPCQRRA
jgi:hypothetical protein